MSSITKAEQIQTISLSEKAPFAGILMPEITYRQLMSDAIIKSYVKTQFENCLTDKAEFQSVNEYNWLGAGFVAGTLAGIALMLTR